MRQNPSKERAVTQELVRAGKVDIPDDQVEQVQKVVAYIQENTAENEKIFDFTSQGAYYFFRKSTERYPIPSSLVCIDTGNAARGYLGS